MVRRQNKGWAIARNAVFGALLFTAAIPLSASAQTSSYKAATDDVVINWDALNGGSAAAPLSGYSSAYVGPRNTNGLMMPGPSTPRSRLYVTPQGNQSNIQLRKPGTAPARKAPVKSASRAPAPAQVASTPAPAPKPAAPAPKPASAPPKAPTAPADVAAAASPPAPAPAAPVATSAPAAPPTPPKAPPAPAVVASPSSAPTAPPPAPVVTNDPDPSDSPEPTQQASAPTSAPVDGPAQVLFNGDNTKLSADGQGVLDGVISKLGSSDKLRVQLMAYAAGEDLSSSKARRISLSRALSVRSYLIEKGVRSTRIDVRALGDKAEGDQKNRVDVNTIEQ